MEIYCINNNNIFPFGNRGVGMGKKKRVIKSHKKSGKISKKEIKKAVKKVSKKKKKRR